MKYTTREVHECWGVFISSAFKSFTMVLDNGQSRFFSLFTTVYQYREKRCNEQVWSVLLIKSPPTAQYLFVWVSVLQTCHDLIITRPEDGLPSKVVRLCKKWLVHVLLGRFCVILLYHVCVRYAQAANGICLSRKYPQNYIISRAMMG